MTGWNKSLTDCVTILMQNGLKLSDARTVGGTMEKSISAMLRYAHRCMAMTFVVERNERVVIDMRILYGFIAGSLWVMLIAYAVGKAGVEIPEYVQWLSTAIIVAGAMAGGD